MSARRANGFARGARSGAAAFALSACILSLSGCIAAAAIPLAAGGALVVSRKDQPDGPPTTAAAVAADRSDLRIVPTKLTALPPPAAPAAIDNPAITAFASYATSWLASAPGSASRQGALLASAESLSVSRAPCGARPPAVFIDLDPGKGSFDPLQAHAPAPQLAAVLQELRTRDVSIVWFSRLGENFAAAARAILADSGLDPDGRDRLVLMRDLGERKQSRRDELAKSLCPIAMLGDERADFDELYLYLRKAEAAVALDAMIGRGWFLASPLSVAEATPPR